jgi:hypothetical protein
MFLGNRQPRRHLWADCLYNVDATTSHNPIASTACDGYDFTSLYVDDVRTSLVTCVWAVGAYYGDSFHF